MSPNFFEGYDKKILEDFAEYAHRMYTGCGINDTSKEYDYSYSTEVVCMIDGFLKEKEEKLREVKVLSFWGSCFYCNRDIPKLKDEKRTVFQWHLDGHKGGCKHGDNGISCLSCYNDRTVNF
jgi:hypothetical protein